MVPVLEDREPVYSSKSEECRVTTAEYRLGSSIAKIRWRKKQNRKIFEKESINIANIIDRMLNLKVVKHFININFDFDGSRGGSRQFYNLYIKYKKF